MVGLSTTLVIEATIPTTSEKCWRKKSDNEEEQKERNIKRKEIGRSLCGRVEFGCSSIDKEKIEFVEGKLCCGKVSNKGVLAKLFNFYIKKNKLMRV